MKARRPALAITSAAAALTLFAAGSATSADQVVSFATGGYASQLRTPEMMHKIDANNDGMVSKSEWDAYQEKLFTAMDADHSGTLDEPEFMRAGSKEMVSFATGGYANALRTPEMLAKLDADQDGKVSRAEFVAYHAKLFDMMDTGKTRMLGQNEFFGRGPRN